MVKIGLQIKARLEYITDVLATGDDFRWYLKVKCLNCGEVPDKWQYVTLTDKKALKSGHQLVCLIIKCKLCSRENYLDILPGTVVPYTVEDEEKFKTVVQFECRGIEPIDFSPRGSWTAKGIESKTVFSNVDLSEREWVDYDEEIKESVGIYDLEHRFVKV